MLKHFCITNFKVFGQRQCLNLAPLTLIYGPNSGGKSTIIQALLLLKQSIEAPINQGIRDRVLVPKGLYVDLGQSKSIHHKHSFANNISFEVGLKIPAWLGRVYSPIFSAGDEFSTSLRFEQRQQSIRSRLPALTEIKYTSTPNRRYGLEVSLVRTITAKRKEVQEQLEIEDLIEQRTPSNFFNFSSLAEIVRFNQFLSTVPYIKVEEKTQNFFELDGKEEEREKNRYQVGFRPTVSGKTTYLPTTVRNLTKVDPRRSYGHSGVLDIPSSALMQMSRMFNFQFESMSYLGPLRSRPKRLYELSQQYRGSIGLSGEYAVEALTSDSFTDSSDTESVIDFVNRWLEKFEVPYTVSVEEIGNEVLGDLAMLKLRDNRTGVWVAATDVGFGIGQLLPVIIQGAIASRSHTASGRTSTICVEQPEIHLHPRLQANIADFFISTMRDNGCQWIIETHSEALMLRIQRRIREATITSADVAVVFVEPAGDCGSRILNLRIDERGNFLDEWPGGFFEDSFTEIFG
jgi:predicted ATPase